MRVLVADDDPGSLMVARAAVEQSGHECVTAADGDSAWELYRTHRPHVVVTDLKMPGLDGLSLCRAIRAADKDAYTYLVLVTSHGSRDDVLAGMDAGADEPLGGFRLGFAARCGQSGAPPPPGSGASLYLSRLPGLVGRHVWCHHWWATSITSFDPLPGPARV